MQSARLIMTAGVMAMMSAMSAQPAAPMSTYKWKNRPLLIFAPSDRHPGLRRQLKIVRSNDRGFRNRDMAVLIISGGSVSTIIGRPQKLTANALRRRYGVSESAFRSILIGKDGGSKLSSSQAITAKRLFRLIDSMPMRQQEIRRRGQ